MYNFSLFPPNYYEYYDDDGHDSCIDIGTDCLYVKSPTLMADLNYLLFQCCVSLIAIVNPDIHIHSYDNTDNPDITLI